jgi:hypothetical protein
MTSMILTIFIEGKFDRILFDHKIKHEIEARYDCKVEPFPYRKEDKREVNSYIDLINHSPRTKKYIFLADLDKSSTVLKRKHELIKTYTKLDESKIVIVCKEIEGWYLGGLSRDSAIVLRLDLKKYDVLDPNVISKSQYQKIKPNHIKTHYLFYLKTAKIFESIIASQRNTSFKTFSLTLISMNL